MSLVLAATAPNDPQRERSLSGLLKASLAAPIGARWVQFAAKTRPKSPVPSTYSVRSGSRYPPQANTGAPPPARTPRAVRRVGQLFEGTECVEARCQVLAINLISISWLGNSRRGVTRIVLATIGRPPYASALTAPATAKAVSMSVTSRTYSTTLSSVARYRASAFLAFA